MAIVKEDFETLVRDTTGESANRVGRAGEHIVCADLLAAGYECFLAEGKAPYDILADLDGKILKVQVKTTSGVKQCAQRSNATPVYSYSARKVGKMQRRGYKHGEADLIAYVALDRKIIAYMPAERVAQSMNLRLREYEDEYYTKTGMFIEDFPLSQALEAMDV